MKKIHLFIFILLFLIGCKEDSFSPISNDTTMPGPVSEPVVENLPGAARISYKLPSDKNLLYVKAVFTRQGQVVEAKSSLYNNFVLLEGFGDTQEREVELYSVSRSETLSAPVKVRINPLPPAIHDVLGSLNVTESFGGLVTTFNNETKTNIVIAVLKYVEDEVEPEWVNIDNYYTSLESGKFAVRGQESNLTKFGLFVRDRWRNHSDTLFVELTPIPEEELDYSKINQVRNRYPVPQTPPLPVDGSPLAEPGNLGSWPWSELYNENYTHGDGFHSNERQPLPAWFAIDLGQTVKLSRYKIWQRMHSNGTTYFYSHGNPHEWEIWGTNTPNDVNSWTLLSHEVMVKPSGLPIGQVTNDDVEIARAGHEYEFELGSPAVRYIAWKQIDNWASIGGATGFLHMSEMKIWGQIQD